MYCQGDIEKDTLKSTLYERLSDTLAICRKIVMQSDMVCLYRKVGPIEIDNDETYRFVNQYDETKFFEDEDDYYEAVADMIATIPDDVLNNQKNYLIIVIRCHDSMVISSVRCLHFPFGKPSKTEIQPYPMKCYG